MKNDRLDFLLWIVVAIALVGFSYVFYSKLWSKKESVVVPVTTNTVPQNPTPVPTSESKEANPINKDGQEPQTKPVQSANVPPMHTASPTPVAKTSSDNECPNVDRVALLDLARQIETLKIRQQIFREGLNARRDNFAKHIEARGKIFEDRSKKQGLAVEGMLEHINYLDAKVSALEKVNEAGK